MIEGAAITFVDFTEIRRVRETMREFDVFTRLAVVVRDSRDAITVQDLKGRILAWNPGAVRAYGWTETEALAMNVRDRIPREEQEGALARMIELAQDKVLLPFQTRRITKDGRVLEVLLTATALLNKDGEVYAVSTTERVTDAKNQMVKKETNP